MIQIPLSLAQGPCWELENRKIDSTMFLQIIAPSFPEATTTFFEGSCIAPEVVQIFERFIDPGPYLPKAQTIWSTGRNEQFRCRFTVDLCEALAEASLHHAEPELFDHLFIYVLHMPLLEWPDAFSNCMWIAASVSATRVGAFAGKLGMRFKYIK